MHRAPLMRFSVRQECPSPGKRLLGSTKTRSRGPVQKVQKMSPLRQDVMISSPVHYALSLIRQCRECAIRHASRSNSSTAPTPPYSTPPHALHPTTLHSTRATCPTLPVVLRGLLCAWGHRGGGGSAKGSKTRRGVATPVAAVTGGTVTWEQGRRSRPRFPARATGGAYLTRCAATSGPRGEPG